MPPNFEKIAQQATTKIKAGETPQNNDTNEILDNNIAIIEEINKTLGN